MSSVRCFIGKIYTRFMPILKVEALLVHGDKVMYAGSAYRAEKICEELGGDKVKVQGVIFPSFIDSHVHLDWIGETLNQLDLRNVGSIEELKLKLKDYAKRAKSYWIYGRGWDQELFSEKRYPTSKDLDEVVNDRPVFLSRVCGHAAVLNTKAMEIAKLTEEIDEDVIRDSKGVFTGLIKERAMSKVIEAYRKSLSDEEIEKFLIDAMNYSASLGVTTVGIAGLSMRTLGILIKLNSEKKLKIRIRAYVRLDGNKEPLRLFKNMGIRSGFGDVMLKVMGFKIILDGALGVRSAYLSEPYSDDENNRGQLNLDEKTFYEIVEEADSAGLQMAVHAIGDACADLVIDAYSKVKNRDSLRHRLEHGSVLRVDQIEKLTKLNIPIAVQPHFIITDWWAKKRLGAKRIKWLYAFKSMLNKGVKVSLSTDSPVEPLNPWETIYASVTRGRFENIEYYEDTKEESLSLEEALYAYTLGSAYIMREEDNLGSLEVGKFADFIILDRDPFEVEEHDLKKIKVLETHIGGQFIYKNN
ncbi:MAG TPA: amidohydrolase [Geobacterales bacterium]|nr:amidohydrolase [Geobacterales bacterium]